MTTKIPHALLDQSVDAVVPTGVVLPYAGSSAPAGWLMCDGSAVSRTTYADLFTLLSTTFGSGNGSTTFNVPDMRGRTPVGVGTGTLAASGVNADVDTSADTLTVAANVSTWLTGMAVVFTLASGTITGLTTSTTYYIVRASNVAVKLATSLANAQVGTTIDFTAKSSPVWTITQTLTTRSLAEKGGEEAHAQSTNELLAHTHGPGAQTNFMTYATGGATSANSGGTQTFSGATLTASTGGNQAMNVMSPYVGLNYIIRT